ncbi:MAG: hypothetical protein ACTSXW_01725 [Candidatus Baldrarchaeia archaeon]
MEIKRSIRISSKLFEKAKTKCAKLGIHVSDLVPHLIRNIVKQGKIKPKPLKTSKVKSTSFMIRKDLWKKFRRRCIDLDLRAFKVVRDLIINWIEKNK